MGAERSFRESLVIEPRNETALNELGYLEKLQRGGEKTTSTVTITRQRSQDE